METQECGAKTEGGMFSCNKPRHHEDHRETGPNGGAIGFVNRNVVPGETAMDRLSALLTGVEDTVYARVQEYLNKVTR